MAIQDSVKGALSMIETDPSKVLEVAFGSKKIESPGQILTKAETVSLPIISFATPNGQHLVMCVDLDPPFTSMPFMGPILHWMQSDLKSQSAGGGAASLVAPSEVPPVASYHPPGPPPISSPHRYVFLLYEQPADFDHKKFLSSGGDMGIWPRVRWNLAAFEKEAKLGPVVAANFFKCNK